MNEDAKRVEKGGRRNDERWMKEEFWKDGEEKGWKEPGGGHGEREEAEKRRWWYGGVREKRGKK